MYVEGEKAGLSEPEVVPILYSVASVEASPGFMSEVVSEPRTTICCLKEVDCQEPPWLVLNLAKSPIDQPLAPVCPELDTRVHDILVSSSANASLTTTQ